MTFWQSLVTAQMAAGFVYADRYSGLGHFAMEGSALLVGWLLWKAGRWYAKHTPA